MTTTVRVRHNFEAAHRLFLTEGKCQQIHGHSWWCTLSLSGEPSPAGILVEFGELKHTFRGFLDDTFDHKLLLNGKDDVFGGVEFEPPGTTWLNEDPTTENLARHICEAMEDVMPLDIRRVTVELWETQVNCATWWIDRKER